MGEENELQLAFLKAEKMRTDIAMNHAKENAAKYRNEAGALKRKIKELQHLKDKQNNQEIQKLKSVVVDLENKAKENDNLELELAFYKAEKQRMEIKIDFESKTKKQVKELNKELTKQIHSEKEKVRRLSQQLNITDLDELNVNKNDMENITNTWQQEME